MKLENQVCGLELAQKLRELGLRQDSIFYYSHDENFRIIKGKIRLVDEGLRLGYFPIGKFLSPSYCKQEHYSAFTVADLGEMLPRGYYSINNGMGYWECWERTGKQKLEAQTEADARAKVLIYLLENKLVDVGELNKKLRLGEGG
jgi:hypothetical protein